MIIQRCDGCDKESPDEDGLFIANEWCEITVDHRGKHLFTFGTPPDTTQMYLLCLECMGIKVEAPTPRLPFLKRLLAPLLAHWNNSEWRPTP